MPSPRTPRAGSTALVRLLGIVTDVHPGETATALLLTLNVFLLLTAYYVIKPVREALILAMESGAEYKSYMGGAIALFLLIAVPVYGRFASRLPRNRLVVGVTLFFATHLLAFYAASALQARSLGLVFYLWMGVFNMMVVAQFWAFANDLYSEAQGKRLFALVGVGASVGAATGSYVASLLIEPLGAMNLLLVSAALLAGCALLTQVVHAREARRAGSRAAHAQPATLPPPPRRGAFRMVFDHRYLTLLAAFSLVFTVVNANGEYMLAKLIKGAAVARVAPGDEAALRAAIGEMWGRFYLWVNVLAVLIQVLLVSRLVGRLGVHRAFFVFPAIALLDATFVALFPILAVLRVGKTLENATDYSLNNTLRHTLWLPTTREMKYIAKQAVDTFFVRMGDVSSAVLVWAGAAVMGLGVRAFALTNVILVLLWLGIARALVRERAALKARREPRERPGEHSPEAA